MVNATGGFSELLWPGIKGIFGDSYEDWEPIWEKLVDIHESDKQFEKFQGITNFGLAGLKDQGAGIPYRDKYQGFFREIINATYGIGTTITYEMMRYEQYDKFKELPKQLAQAVRRLEETIVGNIFNNGFSTAAQPALTADQKSLFNSSHVLVAANNAVLKNTPTTASDLSQSSLEQAYIDVSLFVDDQNLPIVVSPQKLLVSVQQQHLARKILETEYEVDSGNNTINPVSSARMPLEIIVSPWLTDVDAWFVKTDEADGVVFTDVDPVMLDRDNDFDTKNLKFSAMRLFGVAPVNYLGWYGSPGA